MVDFAKEVYQKLHGGAEPPDSWKERRSHVVAEYKLLMGKTAEIRKVLENAEEVAKLKAQNSFNLEHLSKVHGVTAASLDDLYKYAKFQFDAGKYGSAGELLAYFRLLAPEHAESLGALWGKLGSEILTQDWVAAQDSLTRLKDAIEASKSLSENPALQMTNRAWLLHWALFVYTAPSGGGGGGGGPNVEGLNRLIDLSMSEFYVNAVQTTSQHLLRYIAVAHVVSSQRRHPLKELVRVIEQESSVYQDPVTQFILALYSEYNFDRAQEMLKEAEDVLANDYFLHGLTAVFMENARLLIFRSYCKIHQCIDLGMMVKKLGLGGNDILKAETWIVNVVRNEQDAKIDSAKNQIVFRPVVTPIHQKFMEKARGLASATALLQANISRAK